MGSCSPPGLSHANLRFGCPGSSCASAPHSQRLRSPTRALGPGRAQVQVLPSSTDCCMTLEQLLNLPEPLCSQQMSVPSLFSASSELWAVFISPVPMRRTCSGHWLAGGRLEVNHSYSQPDGNAEACPENMTEHDPRRELPMQVSPLPPCSGLRCHRSFVVQKMFGSLPPSFPQLGASVRIGLCFSSLSNPNTELRRQAERSTSPLEVGQGECWRGQGSGEGEEASRCVGGAHSGNKDWMARRQSQGAGMGRGSV